MSTRADYVVPAPPPVPAAQTLLAAAHGCWPLLVGIGLLMLGNGLAFALVGLRASLEGFTPNALGLVVSGYSLGYVCGSLAAPRFVASVGHVRVFGAFASAASVAALVHAVVVDPAVWFLIRVMTGFALAGIYVVAESWLNERSGDHSRGRLLAIYMLVLLGAGAVGPLLLNVADPRGPMLFVLISALVSVAVLPILLTAGPTPEFRTTRALGLRELYRGAPLGVVGCAVTGLSNATLVGLGAVYAERIGLSLPAVSAFVSAAVLGGVVLMWPLGWISDRADRRLVLATVTTLAGAAAAGLAALGAPGEVAAIAAVATLGAFSFPMYSLSLAHANDRLSAEHMLAASSALVLVTGIGASLGPFAAARAMSAFGPAGLFWFLAAVHLALAAFAAWRMARRTPVPAGDQHPAVYLTRSSALAAAALLEASRERPAPLAPEGDREA